MSDFKEAKRLLGEADNLLTQLYLKEPDDNDKRDQIHQRHTDILALLDNMEEPITERFQLQIDKYNEMKDMIEPSEEPVEELMKCPECGVEMEPLSGGGRCKSTNEWRCVEGGHGVWWECAKCGSIDPRHINPIDESRGPGGVLDKAWWRVAAEEERRKKAEERKEEK